MYYKKHVFICINQKAAGKPCCANHQTELLAEHLKSQLLEKEMHGPDKIRVTRSGCLGRCAIGPSMVIYPEGVWYRPKTTHDIDIIIESHLQKNEIVEHLVLE